MHLRYDNSTLPGDNTHPNSPDYVEPAFGQEDAARNVSDRLTADDEAALLVESVADAAGVLGWIAKNVDLPWQLRTSFRELLEHAERTRRAVDAELEALNGRAA